MMYPSFVLYLKFLFTLHGAATTCQLQNLFKGNLQYLRMSNVYKHIKINWTVSYVYQIIHS